MMMKKRFSVLVTYVKSRQSLFTSFSVLSGESASGNVEVVVNCVAPAKRNGGVLHMARKIDFLTRNDTSVSIVSSTKSSKLSSSRTSICQQQQHKI